MFSGIWLGYKICAGHHLKNVCETDLHQNSRDSKNYTKSYNQMKNSFCYPKRVKNNFIIIIII
jgi:hypothetical protein